MVSTSYSLHTRVTISQTEHDLARCFKQWGVVDWSVDYNVPRARLNNLTLSRTERAVTLRWIPRGRSAEVVLPMDRQDSVAANLRVLYLAVDAIRLNEKRGVGSDLMRSAYMQLAAPGDVDLWAAIGAVPGSTYDQARDAYRKSAAVAHPDRGGSDDEMKALNVAWAALCAQQGWAA